MKKVIIIGCLCIFIFSKCKKNPLEEKYFGYSNATINGNLIAFNKATGGGYFNNNSDSIGLTFQKWDGLILKESISFGPMLKQIGTTQRIHKYNSAVLKPSSNYSTLRDDGDVLCDFYDIYEPDSLQNYLTITSYNSQSKEIRGLFQATYLIDSSRVASMGKCRLTAPDTIRIRKGELYTKIF